MVPMSTRQCVPILLLVSVLFAPLVMPRMLDEGSISERHELWMLRHGRVYKDAAEKEMRLEIFKDNVEFIESFNAAGDKSYKLGVNAFADQTNDEFRASRNGYKGREKQSGSEFRYENVDVVPASIDWRTKGAVTPIKDQGQCGSCWAFSVIAATEGITQLSTGKLISLSEQELVDCDVNRVNQGCSGGEMQDGFEFIIKNQGISAEADYPYTASGDTCNAQKKASRAAKLKGYENVPTNNEAALTKAVANQPVSVTIDASGDDFQFYSSGVFTGVCGTELDHAVTAVGYGATSDGAKYWIVKNSWGSEWGDRGYILMERDVSAKGGICGIAMAASYPTV